LAAAHAQGLIHRDIKPANIWLEELPGEKVVRAKILDFGLARATADEAHLTQAGAIIGTPTYMAPEQVAGEELDGRCDLFSLGGVLYRLCIGRVAFEGADTISVLMAVANAQPLAPVDVNSKIPAALSDLVMHLLAKKPADRPASAAAVVQALEAIERGLRRKPAAKSTASEAKPLVPSGDEASTSAPWSPRRWLFIGGGAGAAALLGLVVVVLLVVGGQTPEDPNQGQPKKKDGPDPIDSSWITLLSGNDKNGWLLRRAVKGGDLWQV